MRQTKIYILLFILLLIALPADVLPESLKAKEQFSEKTNQDIARQVKAAFDEVRKTRETTRLTRLENLGEELISYLEHYLNDVNTHVRAEAVNSALKVGGEKALVFAVSALKNSSAQIQKKTAADLYFYYSEYKKHLRNEKTQISGDFSRYKVFSPENIAGEPKIGEALRAMTKAGNSNIEAIFLMSNFPGVETATTLKDLLKRKNYTGKSQISDENALAAGITLAKLNDQEAIEYLSKSTHTQSTETLKFLLKNISEIGSPRILTALSETLENKTYIEGNLSSAQMVRKFRLPKGSRVDTIPLRLCDLALESFVKKLDLKPTFKLHSGIYAEQHLLEVRKLTEKHLSEK